MWEFGNQSGRMWQKYDSNKRAVLAAALPEVLFGNWEPLVKNNACWWEVEEGRHGWCSCKKKKLETNFIQVGLVMLFVFFLLDYYSLHSQRGGNQSLIVKCSQSSVQ